MSKPSRDEVLEVARECGIGMIEDRSEGYPHTTLTNEFLNEAAYEIERNRAAIAELLYALMSVCWIDGRIEADMPAIDAAITKHTQPTTKGSN